MRRKAIAAVLITTLLGSFAVAVTDLKHGMITAAFVIIALATVGY